MSDGRAPRRSSMRVAPTAASRDAADQPRDVSPPSRPLERSEGGRVTLVDDHGGRFRGLVGEDRAASGGRPRTIEVVVDGWRFELEVEDAARAELRARATREPAAGARSGPAEIRAIIPGRVAAVAVVPGDAVVTGQTLLVVEAMKMQNELRAPRDGRVERLAVGVGDTIDLGDLLLVLA
jgi:biotin carboxyl carrier protein